MNPSGGRYAEVTCTIFAPGWHCTQPILSSAPLMPPLARLPHIKLGGFGSFDPALARVKILISRERSSKFAVWLPILKEVSTEFWVVVQFVRPVPLAPWL
jgi:hypothetical protein